MSESNATTNPHNSPRGHWTFGLHGFAEDAMAVKVKQLDALLLYVSTPPQVLGHSSDFQSLNDELQNSILSLASDLAREVHELNDRLFAEELERIRLDGKQRRSAG